MADEIVEEVVEEGAKGWQEGLPQEIRGEAGFKRFDADTMAKSYEKLYGSYRNAEAKIGKQGIVKPESDDQAEWDKYYNELGRPESKEGYEFKLADDFPSDQITPEFDTAFKEAVHKRGLSASQAQGLYEDVMGLKLDGIQKVSNARKTMFEETANGLKREWGGNMDKNTALVRKAVEQFGGEEAKQFMDDNPELGNSPAMAKLIFKMANAMSEDVIAKGGLSALVTSPAQAAAKIAKIDGDMSHPYWKGDKDAAVEYQELLKLAEGIK